MDSSFTLYQSSKIGNLALEFQMQSKLLALTSLCIIDKVPVKISSFSETNPLNNNDIENTLEKIKEYFSFVTPFTDMPLSARGTDFQKKVWEELNKIPLGETRTYGEIAKVLNSSARAVGNACRKNPIQIITPCHRVVSANGIGGYAGKTDGEKLNIKRWLLSHEGVIL